MAEGGMIGALPLPNPDELEEAVDRLEDNENSHGHTNDEAPCTFVHFDVS